MASGSTGPEPQLLHIYFPDLYIVTDVVMVDQSGYCRLINQICVLQLSGKSTHYQFTAHYKNV